MKKVNITLKLSFEVEDDHDRESVKDALYLYLEDQINDDELFTEDTKYTLVDLDGDDEGENEDEED